MISPQEIKKSAREAGLPLDVVEKDYVLGWLLFGVSKSSISGKLAFKGGTALSKVYYPGKWRLSEDLDFTPLDVTDWDLIITSLEVEIPSIIKNRGGISVTLRKPVHTNAGYLQSKLKYVGPVSPNTIKIEMSSEDVVGKVVKKSVKPIFDYPEFSVQVYAIETILAEKIRSIIQRGKVRDYYDIWRLLKTEKFDNKDVKKLFVEKCKAKEITFTGIEQLFPKEIVKTLEPHVERGLTRMSKEKLPTINVIIKELRESLEEFLE